ncbi:hypothetical protein Cni_G19231 [Canna indica]|uniref:Uncharacterized protein n=1 Tax=Canna indica TaxID=4628 RepID=A0AAQ3KLS3_9LILI|nr:hypothetical protein Cni_G19231 [Canna indica]
MPSATPSPLTLHSRLPPSASTSPNSSMPSATSILFASPTATSSRRISSFSRPTTSPSSTSTSPATFPPPQPRPPPPRPPPVPFLRQSRSAAPAAPAPRGRGPVILIRGDEGVSVAGGGERGGARLGRRLVGPQSARLRDVLRPDAIQGAKPRTRRHSATCSHGRRSSRGTAARSLTSSRASSPRIAPAAWVPQRVDDPITVPQAQEPPNTVPLDQEPPQATLVTQAPQAIPAIQASR